MSQAPEIVQAGGSLHGQVSVPGDKSISHRAIVLGAIAKGQTTVTGGLHSGDCQATLNAMRGLGVLIRRPSPTDLVISGSGLHALREPQQVIDCQRSGTTMRLLAGLLAPQPFFSVLSGDPQLLRRPMGRIVEPLRQMGAAVSGRDGGRLPPLALQGSRLRGIDCTLPVASAQVKSALLLAGLYAEGPTVLWVPGPARDHTERMMAAMGASIECADWNPAHAGQHLTLEPGQQLQGLDLVVPGDISSAAYLIVAALLIPGSEVTLEGVGINPTRRGLLDILGWMGGDIALSNERTAAGEPVADIHVRSSDLAGTEIAGPLVVRAIDELPIVAVAACQAHGETVVHDAAELRVKETDRIAATVDELCRLGAQIEAQPDGFVVHGPTVLRGAPVDSHHDHRLAMALTVAGLVARGTTAIHNAGCIADSFPGFRPTLLRLQGRER